jgi:hypothetical protein
VSPFGIRDNRRNYGTKVTRSRPAPECAVLAFTALVVGNEGSRDFCGSFLLFIGPERIQKRPIFAILFRRPI